MKKLNFFLFVLLTCFTIELSAQFLVPGAGGRRTFMTSGSTNFSVPAGVTTIYFEACSGGGGRGGKFTATDTKWGGGGGGGGMAKGYMTVSAGQVLVVNIGNGGTNGTNGAPEIVNPDKSITPATFATPGNAGGATSVTISGTTILSVAGGQPGNGGSSTASGTAGMGGGSLNSNSATCMITESWTGMGGMPGITSNTAINDYSGVGGTVGRMGNFNYLFSSIHFVEPAASGSFVYYLAPYCGNGAGRGTPSSGGYVYLTW